MGRVARALIGVAALLAVPLVLSACGGRAHMPPSVSYGHDVVTGRNAAGPAVPSAGSSSGAAASAATTSTTPASSTPATPKHTAPSASASAGRTPAPASTSAIRTAYETYLLDLSGLDDSLNKVWVDRIASVTTNRLAQASVRQAAALLAAEEHGVGQLRDDRVSIISTGPSSAVLTDCQDEYDFYLVSDNGGAPDPFVGRGDFAGSAQMVLQNGHWLVDVFTTTRVTCSY